MCIRSLCDYIDCPAKRPAANATGMLFGMTQRAEILLLDSTDVDIELGEFESATEARAACAKHKDGVLSWTQPWEGLWEAQGLEHWYRVISRR